MSRLAFRFAFLVAAFLVTAAPASAQIVWNINYSEGPIQLGGLGFANPTVVGSTTVGQLRRDSVTAATQYWGTILDGRGTTNLNFDTSLNQSGNGLLAQFGPAQLSNIDGTFQNGGMYQAARTNQHPFPGSNDGNGQFNFGHGWNYVGQTPNSSNFDMVTVAIHEIGHGLGFLSFTDFDGTGLNGRSLGSPDLYSVFDKYIQRGNGTGGGLLNTDISSSGYGSFTGPVSTLTNGNNATTGLFFGGPLTREVRGGPAPLYAPNTYQSGSSTSHVNDSNAVMNPSVAPNTVKRLQNYEIAMMMDIGWNQYNWNGSSGNWGDGVGNVAQSRWTSDKGIVDDGTNQFNTHAHPGQAPVLPVYGQVTSNIVLNFFGTGSTGYTTTNDLGNIRVVRLNLNSTATAANTITGGTLQFGENSDGSASILTPKIVQQNSGAFTINSDLIISNTTSDPKGGWVGLTVDGSGSGAVNLGGAISGTGMLTKQGSFTLELNGPAANTYTGTTLVNAGILRLNKPAGVNAVTGHVTITNPGTLQLAASDQIADTSAVTLSGGTFSTGATTGFSETVGTFEMTESSTIALGTGSHTLQFTGIMGTPTGTLTITGWSGTLGEPGTDGKVLFSSIGTTPNVALAGFLATTQFTGFSTGAAFLDAGGGMFELAPVPEPATVLALASAALGLGTLARRRFSRKANTATAEPRLLA